MLRAYAYRQEVEANTFAIGIAKALGGEEQGTRGSRRKSPKMVDGQLIERPKTRPGEDIKADQEYVKKVFKLK
jgi:hypothetical protein